MGDEDDDEADPTVDTTVAECHACQPASAPRGRDVHVVTTSHTISTVLEGDRSRQICFRCGQPGHVRYQCLSYKVRLCVPHESGECNDPNCTFAHGVRELRTPWRIRCVRVVKHEGRLVCIGCNSTEHTFRKCPLHQDLMML